MSIWKTNEEKHSVDKKNQLKLYKCIFKNIRFTNICCIFVITFSEMVNIGDTCEMDWQCNGTQFANVCDQGLCSCSPGYIQIDRKCYMYQGEIFQVDGDKYTY